MKRLILIGGHPGKADHDNALTYALRTHPAIEIKVAFCNFARTDTRWDDTDKDSTEMFNRFGGDKKLIYKTISQENFREVSTWADVIYMPGGDPAALKSELDKFPGLAELWDGKIIAGSSAGADVMCASFVFLQDKSIGNGYGWVQATCIPHWGHYEESESVKYSDEDFESVRKKAQKNRPDLPVLCIPEGQFVEFSIS